MSKWEMVRLGDVCNFINGDRGKNYPSAIDFVDSGIAFINAGHLENKRVSFGNMSYITEQKFNLLGSGKVQIGDVLYCLRGSLGKHAMVLEDIKGAIASSLVILRPHGIFPNYLMYCLDSPLILKQQNKVNTGSSQPNLSASSVKEYKIHLPPLNIQKQISSILDGATELINFRKQRLAELDNLIKSVFYDMFGDPVTNPMGWKVKRFSQVASKIGSGATPKGGRESYVSEGTSLIRSMNVYNGYFKYDELAHITNEQAKQLDNVTIQSNDVLLNITGASVARSCIVPEEILPARVNQHVSIIRCDSSYLNYTFANAVLINDSYQRLLFSIGESGGATRQAITKQQIENLSIILPPIELQTRFAGFVYAADKLKLNIKKTIAESQLLFDSLMSRYFE